MEHRLSSSSPTEAVTCPRPCTVFGVFSILGLGTWCDERHECAATYKHGNCDSKFTDLDQIEVPTASRIMLSVVTTQREYCLSATSLDKASHTAKRVADTGHNTHLHQKVFKSAKRVLTHKSRATGPTDELSLMQQLGTPSAEQSTGSDSTSQSVDPTLAISELSSQPPPVEPQPNMDVTWHHSWQQVRRFVAEYLHATGGRHIGGNPLVQLIACEDGTSRSTDVACPAWILDSNRPIHLFTDWRQQHTFPFDVRFTRAFQSAVEISQNLPTIVVTDHVPSQHCPLIVHIAQEQPIFCVYDAVRIERVAGILQWIHRHVVMLEHFSLTFNGRRIQGVDDIPIRPGDVLRVRPVTEDEILNPTSSTEELTFSLKQSSHATWSTISDLYSSDLRSL